MARTYILERDRPKPERPKEKACTKCGVVKPNDFLHFPKKVKGGPGRYDTMGVCSGCKSAAQSEAMKRSWSARRELPDPILEQLKKHKS